ncbi:hypothetical protein DXT09_22185 [Escherichia coli]|nr:hypothetical protein [Escherichia coli]EGO9155002.1 hypothetical protein [Escherichia coli]EHB0494736.1 hypothetical protein [Escherichia coli]EJW0752960.1 hypothetical protein [Escherichia coli]EJZ1715911.1 hypothetical protein [Escherichia coli]
MYITSLYKTMPEISSKFISSGDEWKYLWLLVENTAPPKNPPDIKTATVMLARPGGYLARKNDSPPGPKAIWSGLTRLMLSINDIEISQKTCG